MAKLIRMRIADIVIPPSQDPQRARRGDIKALAADIAANGMLVPILVTKDHILLDGARRLGLLLNTVTVEVQVAETMEEAFEFLEKADHPLQVPYDGRRIFDLRQACAKMLLEQRLIGVRKNHISRTGRRRTEEELAATKRNPWRRRVSHLTGHGQHPIQLALTLYSRLMRIEDLPPRQQQALREAIEKFENSKLTRHAYTEYRKITAELELLASPESIQTAAEQRRLMQDSLPLLRTVARAYSNLTDLHPQITAEEAEAWRAEINAVKYGINRVHKKLLGRTTAN